jgi:polar amino acid transport system substrate-binding protein
MFLDLIAGRLDGVIWPQFLLEYAIQTNPEYQVVEVVSTLPPEYFGEGETFQQVYFTVKKGSESDRFIEKINATLKRIKEDGTLKTIFEKYGMDTEVYLTGKPKGE